MRNKYATKRQFSQPKKGRIIPQKRIPKIVSNAWRCTTFVFNYLYDLIEFFKTILIFKKFPNDTHNPSNLKVPFLLLFLPLFFPLFYPLFFPLFYPLLENSNLAGGSFLFRFIYSNPAKVAGIHPTE